MPSKVLDVFQFAKSLVVEEAPEPAEECRRFRVRTRIYLVPKTADRVSMMQFPSRMTCAFQGLDGACSPGAARQLQHTPRW